MSEHPDFWQIGVDIDAFFTRDSPDGEEAGATDPTPDEPPARPHASIWKEQDHTPTNTPAPPSVPSVPAHVVVAPSTLSTPPAAPASRSGHRRLFPGVSAILLLGLAGWYALSLFGSGAAATDSALPLSDPMAFASLDPADLAPAPLHSPRVHIDAQNRIFLQGVLPVYLHLSTASDADAPTFMMHKNGIPDRAAPLVFGGDGEQVLRYGDDEYYVYADATPPVTEARMLGARSATREEITYYGPGLVTALVSHDALAGVEVAFISIDGAPFRTYSDSLYFGKQKRYNLRHYAVDWVGNAAPPVQHEFIVDLRPPQTALAFKQPYQITTVSPRTLVTLAATDALSGAGVIYYQFDQPVDFQVYTEPFLMDLDEGDHVLYYYAADAVGNTEQMQSYPFYLDRTPPVATYHLSGDQFARADGRLFISPRSSVRFQATDNKVGVAHIEYALNNEPPEVYTDSLRLPVDAGTHQILFRTTDRVLNVQVQDTLFVEMDPHPPTSRFLMQGPTFHLRDSLYITDGTALVLEASDAESGVASIRYRKNNEPEQFYTAPISIREPGLHGLHFYAVDQVNNPEAPKRVSFIVDKTPPEVFYHFSRAPHGRRQEGAEVLGVYAKNTLLYLGATDEVSGTREIYYSINDAPEQAHQNAVSGLTVEGLYTIRIRVEDNVHNTAVQTVRFFIGED